MTTLKQQLKEQIDKQPTEGVVFYESEVIEAVKECFNELRKNKPSFVSYNDWNVFITEAMERMGIQEELEK